MIETKVSKKGNRQVWFCHGCSSQMEQLATKYQIPKDHLEFQEPTQNLPVQTGMPTTTVISP